MLFEDFNAQSYLLSSNGSIFRAQLINCLSVLVNRTSSSSVASVYAGFYMYTFLQIGLNLVGMTCVLIITASFSLSLRVWMMLLTSEKRIYRLYFPVRFGNQPFVHNLHHRGCASNIRLWIYGIDEQLWYSLPNVYIHHVGITINQSYAIFMCKMDLFLVAAQ